MDVVFEHLPLTPVEEKRLSKWLTRLFYQYTFAIIFTALVAFFTCFLLMKIFETPLLVLLVIPMFICLLWLNRRSFGKQLQRQVLRNAASTTPHGIRLSENFIEREYPGIRRRYRYRYFQVAFLGDIPETGDTLLVLARPAVIVMRKSEFPSEQDFNALLTRLELENTSLRRMKP